MDGMINRKDLKVDTISCKRRLVDFGSKNIAFVKIEHIPSSITVTEVDKTQIKARNKAMIELDRLVEIWETSMMD